MLAIALLLLAPPAAHPLGDLPDGARVVLLGGTLIEREQKSGHWEAALLRANAGRSVTVRNLGWSGDTVFGDARAGFDDANKGFERMVTLTKELKPMVVVVAFGHNESFAGKAGLPAFQKGLARLLDALAPMQAKLVLMTPTPFELTPPLVKVQQQNADLMLYAAAITEAADRRKLGLVNLFEAVPDAKLGAVTENGLHLSAEGYAATARLAVGAESPASDAALRELVVAKNRLFFFRWRPQNETYLFGFRKHEQGKNAAEVAEFDPLVAKEEGRIGELLKAARP